MKSLSRIAIAAVLAAVAPTAGAAPTDYAFDSVSGFDLTRVDWRITGVLRNTTTPTTLTIRDATNIDINVVLNRCMPLFLTMTEKPGRYYLNLTVDAAEPNVALISCGLELRN